jgi:hypothetical protein
LEVVYKFIYLHCIKNKQKLFIMKNISQVSANFNVEIQNGSKGTKNVYGSIKFKNDKLSISIMDRNWLGGYLVHMTESLVEKEFSNYKTSTIFSSLIETSTGIVDELRVATQELKANYIVKTKETAKRMFDNAIEKIPSLKVAKETAWQNYRAGGTDRYEYFQLAKTIEKLENITEKGFESFLNSELKHAELHYECSLIKLAERLVAKGISENYVIKSGYVGINFEVTITHELGQVKAWTIIAEGQIIRAHYRYLVK